MSKLLPLGLLWKEIEFDAGHRVPDHKSKCRNLHGHRYKVRAALMGFIHDQPQESDNGMIIDFADFKKALMAIHDEFDHKMILYAEDPLVDNVFGKDWGPRVGVWVVPFVPTAENLAVYIYKLLVNWFDPIKVFQVEVYETPTSMAAYAGAEDVSPST